MTQSRMDAGNTALLVIDVQRGLFEKSTPVYSARQLLDALDTLVRRAHDARAPVIYIQHSSKVLPHGSADWELHPRLQPTGDDLLIEKLHGNAFEASPLHAELARLGARRLVLTGLVTHGCVKATCLGALELGYDVVLAADGHSSFSKDAKQLIEEWNDKLAKAGAQVKSSDEMGFEREGARV